MELGQAPAAIKILGAENGKQDFGVTQSVENRRLYMHPRSNRPFIDEHPLFLDVSLQLEKVVKRWAQDISNPTLRPSHTPRVAHKPDRNGKASKTPNRVNKRSTDGLTGWNIEVLSCQRLGRGAGRDLDVILSTGCFELKATC